MDERSKRFLSIIDVINNWVIPVTLFSITIVVLLITFEDMHLLKIRCLLFSRESYNRIIWEICLDNKPATDGRQLSHNIKTCAGSLKEKWVLILLFWLVICLEVRGYNLRQRHRQPVTVVLYVFSVSVTFILFAITYIYLGLGSRK